LKRDVFSRLAETVSVPLHIIRVGELLQRAEIGFSHTAVFGEKIGQCDLHDPCGRAEYDIRAVSVQRVIAVLADFWHQTFLRSFFEMGFKKQGRRGATARLSPMCKQQKAGAKRSSFTPAI